MLLLYILLALLGQQTPFLESENLKNSESEKCCEQRTISNESFSESEESVNISEICGNEKTNHRFAQKKSEKGCEPRAMSNEPFLESENLKTSESEKSCEPRSMSHETFFESEKSVNISEICGNEKTNHKLVQKKSEKGCEPRAMSNETFLESENLKNSESEKGSEPRAMSNEQKFPNAQGSQHEAQSLKKTVDCCPLTVDYFENQIRLADSLYKNYLPQYNFEEVKAAVMFFDSCEQRAMSHEQRFQNTQSSQHEAQSTSQVFSFSDSQIQNNVDHHELLKFQNSKILEFLRARAHYYHAVGLTERDDIVGACEHYFIALEIMETESENLKTSKYRKGSEQRAMSHEQKFRNAHSSKLEAQSPDYEKIRFLSLIYTRLGELFLSENYCNLAISKHRKALRYKLLLGENKAVANTYKCLGNSYQLYDMPDSALYYYNKSLETNSELPNRLDVEKCIAQILFNKGERDSAYAMIRKSLDKIENVNVRHSYYNVLGEIFIYDKEYDSAVYYLSRSVNSNIPSIKVASSFRLSTIYDSIGNYEKKAYYEKIVSESSINVINKSVIRGEIQNVYDEYKKRKLEKERLENKKKTKVIAISLSTLVSLAFVITILILRKSKRKDKYIASKEEIISNTNEEIKRKESEIKKLIEAIERYRTDINSLKNEVVIKEHEISSKESVIKNMEDDLSAKERELKKLQENIHEYMILINNLNEDNIAKKKQIKSHLEEIENNRQVINDKDRLISIAAEGLITRKDAIAENRNEIARLQAIIGENDMIINRMSKDYKTNEELIAIQTEKIEELKTEINETRNNLDDLRFRNSSTEGRIKSLNAELKKKEELIKKFTAEISNLRYRLERNHIDISNLNNYLQSEVCSKILNDIKELSEKKLKSYALSPLSKEEFVLLLNSANHHLNYFINNMANKYPKLKKEDMYYLCLVIMGLDNNQISSLFGVTYDAINKRKNRICTILGIVHKNSLNNYLLNIIKMY